MVFLALAAAAHAEGIPDGDALSSPLERRGLMLGVEVGAGVVPFHTGVGDASPPVTGRLSLRAGYSVGRLTVGVELDAWLLPLQIFHYSQMFDENTLATAGALLVTVERTIYSRGWFRLGLGPALAYIPKNSFDPSSTGWGGALVLGIGVDLARWHQLALTLELDATTLVVTPPGVNGFSEGTGEFQLEAGIGLRWNRQSAAPEEAPRRWRRLVVSLGIGSGLALIGYWPGAGGFSLDIAIGGMVGPNTALLFFALPFGYAALFGVEGGALGLEGIVGVAVQRWFDETWLRFGIGGGVNLAFGEAALPTVGGTIGVGWDLKKYPEGPGALWLEVQTAPIWNLGRSGGWLDLQTALALGYRWH